MIKGIKIFLVIIIIILVAIIILSMSKDSRDNFEIYFFNAGKADAILLSKNNHYIMIDTGEESLSNEILVYFKNNNITKLDYLIITHFDKDHVGSASKIIDNIEIGEVLQSNVPKESEYYINYLNSLENKNITPITVSGDFNLSFEDLVITVNGPSEIFDKDESNNSSLIVSVTYKLNKFLFMGDSENQRITDYLNTHNETYNFLKVPYHGNYLKRLEDLLEVINVQYAVITSSNKEMEDEKTIELLSNYQIEYFLTRNGSIILTSDGEKITIKQ